MAVLSFRIGHHVVCVSKEEFKPSVMKNKIKIELSNHGFGRSLYWYTVRLVYSVLLVSPEGRTARLYLRLL